MLPRCPVLLARRKSKHSAPRISPIIRRVGFMRSASITACLMVNSPLPSMLASLASSRSTWFPRGCSSMESSITSILSSSFIKEVRQLSTVVLPEEVPPETIMFILALTQASRNLAISGVSVLKLIRSFIVKGSVSNFRMDM